MMRCCRRRHSRHFPAARYCGVHFCLVFMACTCVRWRRPRHPRSLFQQILACSRGRFAPAPQPCGAAVFAHRVEVILWPSRLVDSVLDGREPRSLGQEALYLGARRCASSAGKTAGGVGIKLAGFFVGERTLVGISSALDEIVHHFGHGAVQRRPVRSLDAIGRLAQAEGATLVSLRVDENVRKLGKYPKRPSTCHKPKLCSLWIIRICGRTEDFQGVG